MYVHPAQMSHISTYKKLTIQEWTSKFPEHHSQRVCRAIPHWPKGLLIIRQWKSSWHKETLPSAGGSLDLSASNKWVERTLKAIWSPWALSQGWDGTLPVHHPLCPGNIPGCKQGTARNARSDGELASHPATLPQFLNSKSTPLPLGDHQMKDTPRLKPGLN